jgi:glutathione peroxidase
MNFLPVYVLLFFSSFPGKQSIYDFKVPALEGGVIDFAEFKGKKILIVNVASRCGFTPQYTGLQKLYEQHSDRLVIVGFPSNDFLWQEPGSNADIREFCTVNYGVTFPLAAKTHVRGLRKHPVYRWLTDKKQNGVENASVTWNFNKFLIDEEGRYVKHFSSDEKPDSPRLMEAILR